MFNYTERVTRVAIGRIYSMHAMRPHTAGDDNINLGDGQCSDMSVLSGALRRPL